MELCTVNRTCWLQPIRRLTLAVDMDISNIALDLARLSEDTCAKNTSVTFMSKSYPMVRLGLV